MKIKTVRIKNFRALQDVEIQFDKITTFIGPNGVGKSTILRALDWFFNGKPDDLNETDCSHGNKSLPIEVSVTFDHLSKIDRSELGKYTPESSNSFTAWKIRHPDGKETLSANAKSYPPFNAIREKTKAADKKQAYAELIKNDETLNLPAWTSADAASQALTKWESEHPEQLTESPESLQTNFFGFNGTGKMSGLFDYVLVTADLRASEESTDGKSSIIGRILERSVERGAADEEIAQVVLESRRKQQEIYDKTFKNQLNDITTQLNSVVSSYSPGRSLSVTPAEIDLKPPKTTFEVTVHDGDTQTFVDRQGHGFQRTILISALQMLAQSGATKNEGVICLAIEEPELFQHPIQAQAFAKILRSLAENPEKRVQVMYATHSPYFLEARHFDQIRRVTRSTDAAATVSVHHPTSLSVKNALAGIMDENTVDRRLDHNVADQLSISLFANRALIVEGPTEHALIYGIGDRSSPGCLEAEGVAIVCAGSKTSIPLAHAILLCTGVPTYALFDADGCFEKRAKEKGKSNDQIDKERRNHSEENRKLLKYFKMPEVDFPETIVNDNVAILEDCLESFLNDNWPEWTESCTRIERETGITLEKNQIAYRSATIAAQGEVPDFLQKILSKARGVTNNNTNGDMDY